jgi:lipoprotein-anchoring transpeptidase ErfK/SrfK
MADTRARRKTWPGVVAALIAVAAVAGGAYLLVEARAQGGGTSLEAALLTPSARPSPGVSPSPRPPVERWLVAKAVRAGNVYGRPSTGARVKLAYGKLNINNYPWVFLVHDTREVDGRTWYNVWVAMRPNESRGWIREGDVAIYPTTAKIEIDLSKRTLTVTRRGQVLGTFRVAVGMPGLSTPTGFFFINQKLKPGYPGGVYGALALGTSAFQPKLAYWEQGGPVAIHGTNQPELIGQAVSHGCVRMRDKDVLQVSNWVPTGSPVIIHK